MLRIDPLQRRAYWNDQALDLADRAFELLAALAAQPGRLVSNDELRRAVWPGRLVDPSNLRVHVAALRRCLGPGAVRTIVGRGYLLATPLSPSTPAAPGSSGSTTLLPVPAGRLIGREAVLGELASTLQQHRAACLLGPAGSGKTRVALELARRRDARAGRARTVLWVDLSLLRGNEDRDAAPRRLCRAIAQAGALQWQDTPGESPAHALGQAMHLAGGDEPLLLVLDHAESTADAVEQVLPLLLSAAPALQALVTSQWTLPRLPGRSLRLEPLAVPSAGDDEAAVRSSPSVQLLLDRAQAHHPQWSPADGDWPAIATLVRRLDGLALALELAAARLPLLGVQALLQRLGDGLEALTDAEGIEGAAEGASGDTAGPASPSITLAAALDVSLALMAPAERDALARLTVFEGAFRVDAAVHLLEGADAQAGRAETLLQRLVQHSMLQWLPAGPHGAPVRLQLLQTTRAHARRRLEAMGSMAIAATQARHGTAMARLARQAAADFHGAGDAAWSARWLPDHDDLHAAFDRAHARGDAAVAADIIEALVLGANVTGRLEAVLQRWPATRELARDADAPARARLLGWGNLAQPAGVDRREQSSLRVAAWQAVPGDEGRRGECLAWAMHAVVCQDLGDTAAADEALARCLGSESPAWPVRHRRRCGWLALTRLALAREDAALLARAERLSRQIGSELWLLGAWREHSLVQMQLARMQMLRGEHAAAAALLQATAAQQAQRGCVLDAGRSLGLQCLAMTLQIEAGVSADTRSACAVAERALALSAPFAQQVTHFAAALAALALRFGAPELAAQLLAGAEQTVRTHQAGTMRASDDLARRTRQRLHDALAPELLQRCEAQGRTLSPAALREVAHRAFLAHLAAPTAN